MDIFYNVVLIRQNASDSSFVYSGNDFTSLNDAKKRYHTLLGSYYDNTSYMYVACYIIRSDGVVIDGETVIIEVEDEVTVAE